MIFKNISFLVLSLLILNSCSQPTQEEALSNELYLKIDDRLEMNNQKYSDIPDNFVMFFWPDKITWNSIYFRNEEEYSKKLTKVVLNVFERVEEIDFLDSQISAVLKKIKVLEDEGVSKGCFEEIDFYEEDCYEDHGNVNLNETCINICDSIRENNNQVNSSPIYKSELLEGILALLDKDPQSPKNWIQVDAKDSRISIPFFHKKDSHISISKMGSDQIDYNSDNNEIIDFIYNNKSKLLNFKIIKKDKSILWNNKKYQWSKSCSSKCNKLKDEYNPDKEFFKNLSTKQNDLLSSFETINKNISSLLNDGIEQACFTNFDQALNDCRSSSFCEKICDEIINLDESRSNTQELLSYNTLQLSIVKRSMNKFEQEIVDDGCFKKNDLSLWRDLLSQDTWSCDEMEESNGSYYDFNLERSFFIGKLRFSGEVIYYNENGIRERSGVAKIEFPSIGEM